MINVNTNDTSKQKLLQTGIFYILECSDASLTDSTYSKTKPPKLQLIVIVIYRYFFMHGDIHNRQYVVSNPKPIEAIRAMLTFRAVGVKIYKCRSFPILH